MFCCRILGKSIPKPRQTFEKSRTSAVTSSTFERSNTSVPKSNKKQEQDKYIVSLKYKPEETKTRGRAAVILQQETNNRPVTSSIVKRGVTSSSVNRDVTSSGVDRPVTSSSVKRGVTSSACSTISVLTLNDDGEDLDEEAEEEEEVCLVFRI